MANLWITCKDAEEEMSSIVRHIQRIKYRYFGRRTHKNFKILHGTLRRTRRDRNNVTPCVTLVDKVGLRVTIRMKNVMTKSDKVFIEFFILLTPFEYVHDVVNVKIVRSIVINGKEDKSNRYVTRSCPVAIEDVSKFAIQEIDGLYMLCDPRDSKTCGRGPVAWNFLCGDSFNKTDVLAAIRRNESSGGRYLSASCFGDGEDQEG